MEVTDEIIKIAEEILDIYKKNLEGHSASGNLISTASTTVVFDGRYFEVSFNLEDYWKYLENGTAPHFTPIEKIEEWVKVKRLVPTVYKGKVPTTRQQAYLIARKISKTGTPAYKILDKSLENIDTFVERFNEIIMNQINKEIEKEL